nr:hypothetical protein GCM10020092_055130 [Actinoplanes digitatis]
MPIGRTHHLIFDCPDPLALATFYSRLLGQEITYRDEDFAVVSTSDRASGLAFQRAPDHRPPTWPDPALPQQLHLDVMVEDVATARAAVLGLGATELPGPNVFADPARPPVLPDPPPTLGTADPPRLNRWQLSDDALERDQ